MTKEAEIREDFSAIEQAHADAEQRVRESHDAAIEERLTPARSQARLDDAQAQAAILKAQGDRRLKSGGAALAGMTGIAAIIAALSLWHKPEIIHDTKLVEQTKVVEVPKIIETTKVVEVPKIIEKPVERVVERVVEKPQRRQPEPINLTPPPAAQPPAPPPVAAPTPGEAMTPEQFKQTDMFATAPKCNGKLLSHVKGVLTFAGGSKCYDAMGDGSVDPRVTTTHNDGDLVTCNATGKIYPTGKPEMACYALHAGRVEDIRNATRRFDAFQGDNFAGIDQSFQELFDAN